MNENLFSINVKYLYLFYFLISPNLYISYSIRQSGSLKLKINK